MKVLQVRALCVDYERGIFPVPLLRLGCGLIAVDNTSGVEIGYRRSPSRKESVLRGVVHGCSHRVR